MEYSKSQILSITVLLAEEGHPDSCAKLLHHAAEAIMASEQLGKSAAGFLSEALQRIASEPDLARKFLAPSSRRGRRKRTVEQIETYLRIEDRRTAEPDVPLASNTKGGGHFLRYGEETETSEDQVRDNYYQGLDHYRRIVAQATRKLFKFTCIAPIENARED